MDNVRISESLNFELSASQNIIQLICFLFAQQIVTTVSKQKYLHTTKPANHELCHLFTE